jgi:hypothetical protein
MARAWVALAITVWTLWWVNRGRKKKDGTDLEAELSVGTCQVCLSKNTITEIITKPELGECKRCLNCGCSWDTEYYRDMTKGQ